MLGVATSHHLMIPRGVQPMTGSAPRGPMTASFGEEDGDLQQILYPGDIPTARRMRPIIMLMMGRRGQGKTLAMTAIGRIMQIRHMLKRTGWRIMSNYKVSFADYSSPYLIEEMLDDQTKFKRCFILIDEISSAFPSRRSMARANVDWGRMLEQIRKFPAEMIFTTQFPQVLDYQLLLQVDYFLRCNMAFADNAVDLDVYDYWGQDTGKDYRKPWPPRPGEQDWERRIGNISQMYGAYNTGEQIGTIWSSSRERIIEDSWGQDVPVGVDADLAPVAIKREPTTLAEYLEVKYRGGFNVEAALGVAKRMNGAIKNQSQFIRWLSDNGYHVGVQEEVAIAERIKPGDGGHDQ